MLLELMFNCQAYNYYEVLNPYSDNWELAMCYKYYEFVIMKVDYKNGVYKLQARDQM